MKDLQKTQNKLIRYINKSTIKDKINTGSMFLKHNMASVNQLNAQIKLTETWKSLNLNTHNNDAINDKRVVHIEGNREQAISMKLEPQRKHKKL